MSLQLERDSRAELQAHLDELTGRTTLIFAVIVGMTLLFSTQIDAWLDQLLTAINPCQTECLNLYDPARWSAVRWLSALLVALLLRPPSSCNKFGLSATKVCSPAKESGCCGG